MKTCKFLTLATLSLMLVFSCEQREVSPHGEFENQESKLVEIIEGYGLRSPDFQVPEEASSDGRLASHVTQKSITIGNEEVAYFETTGTGPDVFLLHGTSSSSSSYVRQLNSILGRTFHLISMDLAGHGLSGNSPDPAITYQLPGHSTLVVAVAEALNMSDAVFVGWSLGGNILLQAAADLPEAKGIMIFGSSPAAKPYDPTANLPSEEFGLIFKPDLSEAEIQAMVPLLFKPEVAFIPEVFFEDVRRQDPLARLFLGVTVGTGNYNDQVQIVENLTVPLVMADGEFEQISNIDYQRNLDAPSLWLNHVWEIPHAGHIAQYENPYFFNLLLAAFVIDCNF